MDNNLTTGLEDPEKVMIALLFAVGAAEEGRPTLIFLSKEGVRLAQQGVATGVACEGCPSISDLVDRFTAAGGKFLVCPICNTAKKLGEANFRFGRDGRDRHDVALDRRRGRHDIQLLSRYCPPLADRRLTRGCG